MLPEDELVDLIARAAGSSREVLVGIGDDAAVLAGGLVASTDILVDGVHFDSSRMDARAIGHRAAAANLSDMAAMGARPLCLLAAVGLPGNSPASASWPRVWPPMGFRWPAATCPGPLCWSSP